MKGSNKIAFLFPHGALRPIGGFKMVFEYANRLVKRGWDVTLVYPCNMTERATSRDILRFLGRKITRGYQPDWFPLDRRIHQEWVFDLDHYRYDKDCIVVGTFINTVLKLNLFDLPPKQKVNFIQDFEKTDEYAVEDVYDTYRFKMKKIVISRWLREIVESLGEKCYLVPNGFDFSFFKMTIPIETRLNTNVIFMHHVNKRKDVEMAFRAFHIVKEHCPQLHVTLFSAYDQPEDLPEWFDFYHSPDRDTFVRLYNEAAIYVGSSIKEGWGLTVGEAMMCGCAVACTDNKGYLEMAKDGVNALVSPVGDAEALAANIIRLIEDRELRCQLAKAGNEFIKEMDIEKSAMLFEKAMLSDI